MVEKHTSYLVCVCRRLEVANKGNWRDCCSQAIVRLTVSNSAPLFSNHNWRPKSFNFYVVFTLWFREGGASALENRHSHMFSRRSWAKGKSKEFVAFNQEMAYFSVLPFQVQICIKKSHLYLIGAWSSLELLAAVGHLASIWEWALSFVFFWCKSDWQCVSRKALTCLQLGDK